MEEIKFSVFNDELRITCSVNWKPLFSIGELTHKGDPVVECEFKHRDKIKKTQIFTSEKDGYYHISSQNSYSITLISYEKQEDLFSLYIPKEEVTHDYYTSEKEISWRDTDGMRWLYSCNGDLDCFLKYSLYKNSPCLTLYSNRECGVIRKSDVIIFLFEDNSTLPIKVTNPSRRVDDEDDELETSLPLSGKDLEVFMSKEWKSFRIDHTNRSPSTEYENICGYGDIRRPSELSGTIFKLYTQKFVQVLTELGIEWNDKPIIRQQNYKDLSINSVSDGVYVYLMVDTTNGFYKIGISNNPEYRERTLQSEKPTIEMICTRRYPTREIARCIESSLHSVYSSKHIRGEWFRLDETDVKHLIETLR